MASQQPHLAPLASNQSMRYDPYRQFTGFDGLPSTGMGQAPDAMMQMMIQMFGGQMMNQYGMLPMGLSQANLADRLERARLQEMHDEAVRDAFKRDVPGMVHTMRGFATQLGMPFDANMIRQTYGIAEAAAAMGPAAIQMLGPQLIDEIAGQRGSAGVMAEYMFQGSQFRLDPVTGRAGMSVENLKKMQNRVYDNLFGQDAYLRNTGMGAGMSGQVFSELSRYGMLPAQSRLQDLDARLINNAVGDRIQALAGNDSRTREQDAELRRLRAASAGDGVNFNKLSPDDISNLRQTADISDALVTLDAGRVSDTLENYGSTIQAMREIFGDAGRPNAPVPELINALNALSSGALSQLKPAELESMVRTTYNLARNAGVGIEGLMVLTQAAEVQAAQYGLPPVMANELVQQSLAFRGAYMHQGMGSYAAFGRGNIDEQTMLNQQMTAGGMTSPNFNRMSLAMRIADNLGEFGGRIKPGSKAEAYIRAVQAGLPEFVDPETGQLTSVNKIGSDDYTRMMQEGVGINPIQLDELLEDKFTNMGYGRRYSVGATNRRAQNAEIRDHLREQMRDSVQAGFSAAGVTGEAAGLLASAATDVAMTAYADERIYADDQRRESIVAGRIRNQFEAIAKGGGPGARAAQRLLDQHGAASAFWTTTAAQQYSEVQEFAEAGIYSDPTTAQNLLTQIDPELSRQATREFARERTTAEYQRALAPLQRGSMLRRFVTAMQTADQDTDFTEIFLESIGGERMDVVRRVLTGTTADRRQTTAVMQGVQAAQQAFRDASKSYQTAMASGDPNRIQQAYEILHARSAGLREANQGLTQYLDRQGLFTSVSVAENDVKDMMRSRAWVSEQLQKQTAGEDTFRKGVAIERQQAGDLISTVSEDQALLIRLGSEGRDQLNRLRSATQGLDELSIRHADGSLADLLRGKLTGDLSDKEKAQVMNEARRLRRQQDDVFGWFQPRVEGFLGYSFLSDDQADRLEQITGKLAKDDRLKNLFVGTPTDIMQASDPEFKRLQASAAWGQMSETDRQLVMHARAAYSEERERASEYSRDRRRDPERVIRESIKRLTGEDLTIEQISQKFGLDMDSILSDTTAEGERRRGGLSMISRDVSRFRELEKKKKKGSLTPEEAAELKRLRVTVGGYDEYWRNLGGEFGADDALSPDVGSFAEAYENIPSQAVPELEEKEKPANFVFHITNMSVDSEDLGAAEASGQGTAKEGLGDNRGM